MFCKNCGIQVPREEGFCKNCGEKIIVPLKWWERNKFLSWFRKKLVIVVVIFIAGLLLLAIIGSNSTSNSIEITQSTQDEISQSVVNIFCPSAVSGKDASGGSGTIINEDGLILTNSHIIPQDETNIFVDDTGCLVVLPDPATGQPKDVYLAHPIVIPGISDNYDLAYMQIYSAYYDEEKAEYAGIYPRTFPSFDDTTRCRNENMQLGEPVRIFGYPAISGGYSLTVTDGVVSSFPGEGLIVTSAKISHGNSGGLAIDRYGCMIGVPSMVSSDEAESLGVIFSMALVRQFDDEVTTYINNLK
jgi:hypothetical protein